MVKRYEPILTLTKKIKSVQKKPLNLSFFFKNYAEFVCPTQFTFTFIGDTGKVWRSCWIGQRKLWNTNFANLFCNNGKLKQSKKINFSSWPIIKFLCRLKKVRTLMLKENSILLEKNRKSCFLDFAFFLGGGGDWLCPDLSILSHSHLISLKTKQTVHEAINYNKKMFFWIFNISNFMAVIHQNSSELWNL